MLLKEKEIIKNSNIKKSSRLAREFKFSKALITFHSQMGIILGNLQISRMR